MSLKPGNRHYTIPVFIPMEACPFHCIFCDQEKISGRTCIPSADDVTAIIHQHLATIPQQNSEIEVGFFGGTFTGLTPEEQRSYLDTVLPFIDDGRITGIRLSTRPDFITPGILDFLKKYPVKTIELGAQSMDDEVLKRSGRGHTSQETEIASNMILDAGFRLGLQMMIGLPGDTEEKSIATAKKIIVLGASETRVYPVIVIKGTPLEKLYREGKYVPLDLEEAIRITKNVVSIFDESSVKVIRIGLHPSEGLLNRNDYIDGPFHVSFRELVMTSIWTDRFNEFTPKNSPPQSTSLSFKERGKPKAGVSSLIKSKSDDIVIRVNPADLHPAIGYYGKNRKLLEKHFRSVKFVADPEIEEKTFYVDHC